MLIMNAEFNFIRSAGLVNQIDAGQFTRMRFARNPYKISIGTIRINTKTYSSE